MDRFRESVSYVDSPSKQSYIGSYYNPPEKMSHQMCATTVPLRQDKAKKAINLKEITAQTYQTTPDAGSRAVIAALKTLQEKMRRLELERVQAERNVEQFSQAAHCYSSSIANTEPQVGARGKDSTRRKELVSQLHSAEARCSLLEKQLDYMRKMLEDAERERITSVNTEESKLLSAERTVHDPQIQTQLQKLDRLERQYVKLTTTQSEAERKIEHLELKLLEEEHERKLVQEKAEELQRELEANLFTISTAEVKHKRKKSKEKALSKKSVRTEVSVPKCLPKAKRMPFVAGTSTSPSHSLNANVQSVLHLMKTRQPRLCEKVYASQRRTENHKSTHQTAPSPSERAAALDSLSELLLALQDELGQMSFEHQELVKQIDETDQFELKEDLERELDCLVRRMEEKSTQISKLRKHQQTVQKLSQCSPKQKARLAASAEGKNLNGAMSGVQALPCSPVKVSSSRTQKPHIVSQERLQLLRNAQKLRTSLRQQDINWET
ncbi:centrosomal protein CEP57L1 [Hoplias malabaricus]|uniref:centrosomal protein CEP57L1 n=1 Tax=Hoplias malabaricus TaxID=27720 RepID=UPI003462E2E3